MTTTKAAHTAGPVQRAPVTYGLTERTVRLMEREATEYRVMHGNKIVARYWDRSQAEAHRDRLAGAQ